MARDMRLFGRTLTLAAGEALLDSKRTKSRDGEDGSPRAIRQAASSGTRTWDAEADAPARGPLRDRSLARVACVLLSPRSKITYGASICYLNSSSPPPFSSAFRFSSEFGFCYH